MLIDNIEYEEVAYKMRDFYIFYDTFPYFNTDVYIDKRDLDVGQIIRNIVYRALEHIEQPIPSAKITQAVIEYKIYLDCEGNYIRKPAILYREYPCCKEVYPDEDVYLHEKSYDIDYNASVVKIVAQHNACESLKNDLPILYNTKLVPLGTVWIKNPKYMGVVVKWDIIWSEEQGRYFRVEDCRGAIKERVNCSNYRFEDYYTLVGDHTCCTGMRLEISALYSKFNYGLEYRPVDNVRVFNSINHDLGDITVKGCDTNLAFFRTYKFKWGKDNKEEPIHLTNGYKYKYYYTKELFQILDGDNVVFEKQEVVDLNGLNVDFETMNSCDFEFIVPQVDNYGFIFPVKKINQRMFGDIKKIAQDGVNNMYIEDSERPYTSLLDNPSRSIFILGQYDNMFSELDKLDKDNILYYNWNNKFTIYDTAKDAEKYFNWTTGILKYPFNWAKMFPENDIYKFFELYATGIHQRRDLHFNNLEISTTIPKLSIDLYPQLLSILRFGETHNNRPVYEPWMIWGFYKFLWSKGTKDIDDTIKYKIFDLSPNHV